MLRRLESLSPSAASVCVICVCCVCPAQDTYVLQTNKGCQDLAVKDSTGLLLVGVPKRSLRPGH